MFLNMDQLEKQLDKEEFQEIGSMAAFKYFIEYTQLEILEFHDTLIQHMESVKKTIDKRSLHKREYDSRVNERHMQTIEEKVDTSKALDASLVKTESSGTESRKQDTSNRSGNDAHADDADIRPIYDEEPMAENAEQCHDTRPLSTKLTDNQTTELSNQSLKSKNICFKKTVAQFQKDFSKLEAHCINLELQLQNNVLKSGQQSQFLKEKSNEAKVKNDIDVIETINIELEHKVAKLLKENETLKNHYKELYDSIKVTRTKTIEQTTSLIAKNDELKAQLQEKGFAIAALKNELRKLSGNSVNTKFAKQSILGKPVLQPHRNQSVVRQPTAFKNSSKNLPRFSSNDRVHNHYLEEARKKTQKSDRNSRPSVMPSAKSQSTANVNSRAMVPSHKTTTRYKPVEQISIAKKLDRQIPTGHRFSIKKTSVVHEKIKTPRSCLRWKPTGRILKTVGLRWVPIGKIFESSTTKVDSKPPHGTPFNLKKERIKTWTKDNVISGRPRLHRIASLQEISARPSSQGIRSLLTS
ncbi:hypothetical protein Tco_0561540 [Tanacetum coccineum]